MLSKVGCKKLAGILASPGGNPDNPVPKTWSALPLIEVDCKWSSNLTGGTNERWHAHDFNEISTPTGMDTFFRHWVVQSYIFQSPLSQISGQSCSFPT